MKFTLSMYASHSRYVIGLERKVGEYEYEKYVVCAFDKTAIVLYSCTLTPNESIALMYIIGPYSLYYSMWQSGHDVEVLSRITCNIEYVNSKMFQTYLNA